MAGGRHVVLLVEEPSMEAFQGKADLMSRLEDRLRGYSRWMPDDWRLVVVLDRDDDDCIALKNRLERMATGAGLLTRTRSVALQQPGWQLVNRIAVEELEAWYFGDWPAVQAAYPRVSRTVTQRRGFRNPDAIAGGTWEAFERVMQRDGYFKAGLAKIEAARAMGAHADPARSISPSFRTFHAALMEAVA
jgi:hypothetical protein